ncbi:MAG: hypothetical protein HS104_37075 [Polyangiaceae bacterium]|nr:hypothetical protein [Polyangiaceae bacterium]MCL4751069.1 hypothetical protein [Myxococcales bacterium]
MSRLRALCFTAALLAVGCADDKAEPSPPCDEECRDRTAVRALRETMKLVYNITLQGNPVGPQDESTPCPLGGSAHVFGTATSNAKFGATEVELTYELAACHYLSRDEQPSENYDMTVTATVTQTGTLAVQPSATTALVMQSASVTLSGNVYDPPLDYLAESCAVELGQSGNNLSGTICGREVGLDL